MLALFYQLLNCNLFTQHVIYLMERHHKWTVDPGPFFYIVITVYHLLALFTFLQTTIFYHSIRLILCLQHTGEIDNLTVSWGKVLGYVVCSFHVATGAKLRPRRGVIYKLSGAIAKLASINLRNLVLSPTGSINVGFILREDLLLCSSYLPLGIPNWAVIYTQSVATKGTMQNLTTLIFMGGGPCRNATSWILGIISAYSHIMNYFWPKSI
jgi:hypothetical protein